MMRSDSSDKKLIVASHNEGKVREISALLTPYGFEVCSAADYNLPEPEETGTTFEQNAFIKAHAATHATGLVALSDDSGLCVDALDGAPGVYTADWAEKDDGSGRDFYMAMEKVERALKEKGALEPGQRSARFVAVLCLCQPDCQSDGQPNDQPGDKAQYFRGEVEGQLVWPPRGDEGFGYDPVFLPDGHTRTFGQMSAAEKHGVQKGNKTGLSHRARAFAKFAEHYLG